VATHANPIHKSPPVAEAATFRRTAVPTNVATRELAPASSSAGHHFSQYAIEAVNSPSTPVQLQSEVSSHRSDISQPGNFESSSRLSAPCRPRGEEVIQRVTIPTLGGRFADTKYEAHNEPRENGAVFGADLWLDFLPSEMVQKNASMIGLVQTVKTLKTTENNPHDVPKVSHTPEDSPQKAGYKLKEDDIGRGIDKRDRSEYLDALTNTNPLYATDNARNYSTSLDNSAQPGLGAHWNRLRPTEPAKLIDRPRAQVEFPGQSWRQSFEVSALVVGGTLKDVYLGSIEWGVQKPANGNAELDPASIRLVRVGTPSSGFMRAAKSWNEFQGGTRTLGVMEQESERQPSVPVVKLPVVTDAAYSHHLIASDPNTLIIYLAQAVNGLQRTEDNLSEVEKANTNFNIGAMSDQLVKLKGGDEFFDSHENYVETELRSFDERVRSQVKKVIMQSLINAI
jgi:hypothetical protein